MLVKLLNISAVTDFREHLPINELSALQYLTVLAIN